MTSSLMIPISVLWPVAGLIMANFMRSGFKESYLIVPFRFRVLTLVAVPCWPIFFITVICVMAGWPVLAYHIERIAFGWLMWLCDRWSFYVFLRSKRKLWGVHKNPPPHHKEGT